MIVVVMMIASYTNDDDRRRDDVRIVYSLANTMQSFSVTDGGTDEQGDSRSRIIRLLDY